MGDADNIIHNALFQFICDHDHMSFDLKVKSWDVVSLDFFNVWIKASRFWMFNCGKWKIKKSQIKTNDRCI